MPETEALTMNRSEQFAQTVQKICWSTVAAQQLLFPVLMWFRYGLHGQKILSCILKEQRSDAALSGVTRGKYRRPFASTSIRAGSLNQSDCTLSFGSACLITHAGPVGRVSRRVLLDTPPLNFRMIGFSEEPIRPVSRRYLDQLTGILDVNHGPEAIAKLMRAGAHSLETLLGELAQASSRSRRVLCRHRLLPR